jgi:myo-inositol catabolism protein IolC
MSDYVGMEEAGRLLQVSGGRAARAIIEREIELGAKLDYVALTPRARMIRKSDLDKIIAKRQALSEGTGVIGKGRPKKDKADAFATPAGKKAKATA